MDMTSVLVIIEYSIPICLQNHSTYAAARENLNNILKMMKLVVHITHDEPGF